MYSPGFPVTPDGSVHWVMQYVDKEPALLAPIAPEEVIDWLAQPASELGPHIKSGQMGSVYHIANTDLVIKESHRDQFQGSYREWRRNSAFPSFFLNVALEIGLQRIGDDARLPDGSRLTTPTYLGVYATRELARVVMTFEQGNSSYRGDLAGGDRWDRREIYDKAIRSVGGSPNRLAGYDDTRSNLLIREQEVVKLDACNLPL